MVAPVLPLLEALPRARQVRPGAWVACCPAHEDATPSLSWTTNGDGNVGIKCFAGCSAEAIVGALGEPMSSLFEAKPTNGHTNGVTLRLSKPQAGTAVRTRRFIAIDTAGRAWTHTRHEDATGRAVGDMKWQLGVKLATLLPYGVETVATWPANDPIFLVEGEATTETLRMAGLPVIGTFGVQYKPDPAALAALAGRRLILWPDADDVGRSHMLDMARRLDGIAEALRWIEPPGDVFKGWDAADADAATIARLVAEAGAIPAIVSAVAPAVRRPDPPEALAAELVTLVTHLRRYVWFSKPEQAIAVALWIAHTHALDAVEQSPVLAITSPVKQSGKSRLLEVISTLVPVPWTVERPSEAVLYRRIERDRPTLLMDEADTIFEDRKGQYEGIRAVFNAGNRRGTVVSRVMPKGKTFDLQDFSIFCAKAIAGIGRFPETIVDRSIVIAMTRRTPGEQVERLRSRTAVALGEPIRDRLAELLAEASDLTLTDAQVTDSLSLRGLGDRGQDNWESLVALADRAGGEWPDLARSAALTLDADRQEADDNAGVTLLTDLRDIFDDWTGDPWIPTVTLLESLQGIESSPWSEWRQGKPLTARGMARLLDPFGVKPDRTRVMRGYARVEFADAWSRFVPLSPAHPSQASQPAPVEPPDLWTEAQRIFGDDVMASA
jgi:hypothetical protein